MDSQLSLKEINKSKEIKVEPNNVVQENIMNDNIHQANNQVMKKDETEVERDKALDLLKEELKMQSFFNVKLKSKEIEDGKENIQKINYNINKLKELQKLEENYKDFQEKYFEEEGLTEIDKEILYGFLGNKFGDIQEQIEEIKKSEENIRQDVNKEVTSLKDKINQYKENINHSIEERRQAVNNEFEKGGIVKSSKNKKRKGREKGLALQGKVIGATEETAAMSYDMQHRKKKIDKWYKKPPKIKDKDIVVDGNEFNLVFKNKSGSAMDIKSIMEKIALLDLKIKSMSSKTPEKVKYMKHHEVLAKTLKIVCAANGIDSETGTFFVQETEEQKLEVKKKVEFANSVYKKTLGEYRKNVMLGTDYLPDYIEEEINIEEKDFSRKEQTEKQMEKTKSQRADITIFLGAISKLKLKKDNANIDEKLWNNALRLCNSFDSDIYPDIYDRKNAVKKETKYLSNFLDGNNAEMLLVVGERLKELDLKGINIDNAFNIEMIKGNIDAYQKFAAAIELVNYAREKSTDKKDFDNFMSQDETYMKYNNIARFSLIKDYSEYINKIAMFDSLNEREKKVILYKTKECKEQLYQADLEFERKWKLTGADLEQEKIEDMCKFTESMDVEYKKAEMKPMYTESINELMEYIEGLEDSMKELEVKAAKFEKLDKVSTAVKDYITGTMLQDKYYVRVKALNDMKKIDRTSLSSQLAPQYTKKAAELIGDVKKIMDSCERETLLINEVETIINDYKFGTDNLEQHIEKIKNVLPESDIVKHHEAYLKEIKAIKDDLSKHQEDKDIKKQKEKYLKEKEKEDALNFCKMELIALYATQDFSESQWEKYFKKYKEYEIKYNGKKEKDIEKKKESLKKEITDKFYFFKDDFEAYAKEQQDIISNCSVANDKYKEFEEGNKEDFEKYELEAKQKENEAHKKFIDALKVAYDKHKEERINKFVEYEKLLFKVEDDKQKSKEKGKKSEYGGLSKEEVLREITDDQMSIYINERNNTVFETYINIKKMSGDAYSQLLYEIDEYKKEMEVNDLNDYINMDELEELFAMGSLESGEQDLKLKNEKIDKCLLEAEKNKKEYDKIKNEYEKAKKTLEDAKKVLADEKKSVDKKYTNESKEESYVERHKKTSKFFGNIKSGFIDKAILCCNNFIKGDEVQKDNINKLNSRFIEYKEKVEALLKEKQIKENEVNFLGITYNTVAIQDFLLNTDKDKYKKVEEKYGEKLTKDPYVLKKSDFEGSQIDSGYATVNFEKLMYKRNKLVDWVEDNRHLEKKEHEGMSVFERIKEGFLTRDQQEYYERKEMLESLNKYLKLYCEANGVDFETGELFADKKDMSKEAIKEKVISSSTYLDETMADIQAKHIDKKDDGDEDGDGDDGLASLIKYFKPQFKTFSDLIDELLKKAEFKTGELYKEEEEDHDVSLGIELYAKELFEVDTALLKNETKKRTAHSIISIATKIAECKASAKAGLAVGLKSENKEEQRGRQAAGGVVLGVEASFSGLSSEFLLKYSNKILNTNVEAYAKGKVDVGHAKANAGLEMALKNEKGEFSPHLSMEAGLELALLKLEGSVGAKMMGVGVEAQLSFIAGLVAKGNVKFSGWQLEIELEAALGIGVGVKLKLDFSDLKDKLVDLAKKTGGKIADVMCEKLCRWGFYSQREMWYNIMRDDIESLFKDGEGLMNQDERVTI